MQLSSIKLEKFSATHFAILFILLHLFCWTLIPALVRYNLPLDSIEGTIWGHQLEWGYDKNPFLNGWLTALAVYLGGASGWMIYFFSQLSVAACFLAVWLLAKNMLPKPYALVAILLLEGIQYFNFHAIDFNDNTLELGLWGFTIYFFYKALRENKMYAWILTGFIAALAMMAKYYTAALLAAMVLFLLLPAENRKHLSTLSPYAGLAAFLAVIMPHVIWLTFHDFITVQYVFARASSVPSWTNHFFYPAQFTWQQLQVFLPALILFSFLFIGKKPLMTKDPFHLAAFDKAFLFYIGLGPFLLTLLLSIIFGITLRAGWGMPLLSLWSIMLVAAIQPRLSKAKIIALFATIFILMAILLGCYARSLIDSPDESSANFPGREIANKITQEWHASYHTKLEYVAGSRWVGGNIGFYSTDHPAVFIEWNQKRAPWIDLKDLQQKGAIFIWSITDKESMPKEIAQQFPQLKNSYILTFNWQRNTHHLPPIQIGVAILPPRQ